MRTCDHPGCEITLRSNQPGDRCHHHLRAPGSPDEEFAAALERETDRSLAQDPSRWVLASGGESFTSRARSGAEDAPSPYRRHGDPGRRRRDRTSARDPADDRWD